MKKQQLLTLSISSILLIACGGGGGASATLQQNPKPTTSSTGTNKPQQPTAPSTGTNKPQQPTAPSTGTNKPQQPTAPSTGTNTPQKPATPSTPTNNGLTQNYTVPANLQTAAANAKKRVFTDDDPKYKDSTIKFNGKTYKVGDTIDFGELPLGYSERVGEYNSFDVMLKGPDKLYHMPYSITIAEHITEHKDKTPGVTTTNPPINELSAVLVGLNTTEQQLPNVGKATYTGIAMTQNSNGKLHVDVDFSKRQGGVSGQLTGLDIGTVTLSAGEIKSITVSGTFDNPDVTGMGFIGDAQIAGKTLSKDHVLKYVGQFFGPKAQEVGGFVDEINPSSVPNNTTTYGVKGYEVKTHAAFAGQRGEIKP